MSIRIFETQQVQEFLRTVSGFEQAEGNDRAKRILHRVISDLYRLIDDFDVTPEEYWSTVSLLNELGQSQQFGLLSPGLGFDHFLDMREDAADAEAHRNGGTPRTIEGPLYVAGAPEARGYARMDDDPDPGNETMWLSGQVRDVSGQPIANAKVEIWHANSKGGYSFFDSTQSDYNLRRTILTDEQGRYRVRSVIPSGYGVPEGSPTERVLDLLGRHGQRPAHIHFFISAPGYRHLTTQINLAGDVYTWDDFAFATREELVVPAEHVEDAAEISRLELDGPFMAVSFDVVLEAANDASQEQRHKRDRALESL